MEKGVLNIVIGKEGRNEWNYVVMGEVKELFQQLNNGL